MKNTRVVFLMVIFWYIFAGIGSSLCFAQKLKQPPVSPGTPAVQDSLKPATTVPDYPRIREFSLTPDDWLMTETGNVIFNWKVDPGAAGTPLSGIAIARESGNGPSIEYTSTDGTGQYVMNITSSPFIPEGKTTYKLTATNKKGTTNTKTVEFLVKPMSLVRDEISMASLVTEPAEIPEGAPFIFVLRLSNRGDVRVPNVNIPITGKDISLMGPPLPFGSRRPPPNQGELRGQIINPGINEYRIRCSPGIPAGLANRYFFEIVPEYKNWRILGICVRLEFVRRSGTTDLYRILVYEMW